MNYNFFKYYNIHNQKYVHKKMLVFDMNSTVCLILILEFVFLMELQCIKC